MSPLPAFLCCFFIAMMHLSAAQPCQPDHQLCSPEGATTYETPVNWSSSGPVLADFYEDLVYSVNQQPSKRHQHAKSLRSSGSSNNLCCAMNTQCLLLEKSFVAFCWDHFTTNYYMPDGSYGNIASGIYNLASGKMNLISGNYTIYSSGQDGDLYSGEESPQTSTLPMPTPWTSKGVGTAIPGSEVGETTNYTASSSMASHTITLPLSNVPGSTSNPAPTAPSTATAIHGNVVKFTPCSFSKGLLLVALAFSLL